MTHSDIYTKFMIEYDKANVTSSYPSLTPYEIATILDKAYLALIAQKLTGNNPRQVGFEWDIKAIEDIQPLVTTKVLTTPVHNAFIDNQYDYNRPDDVLYFINGLLKTDKITNAIDREGHVNLPVHLISHDNAMRFYATNNNLPWIPEPVVYEESNTMSVLVDSYKLIRPLESLDFRITYIKYPAKFAFAAADNDDSGQTVIPTPEEQWYINPISGKNSIYNTDNYSLFTSTSYSSSGNYSDVIFQIVSGNKYAEITSSGKLTVLSTATIYRDVIIKATCANDPSVSSITQIKVKYYLQPTSEDSSVTPSDDPTPGGNTDSGGDVEPGGNTDPSTPDTPSTSDTYKEYLDKFVVLQVVERNSKSIDYIRDVDLNDFVIMVQVPLYYDKLCVDSSKEVLISNYYNNDVVGKGHFEIYSNFAKDYPQYAEDGFVAIKLIMDKPIKPGDLDSAPDLYCYEVEEATFGDSAFGDYLSGKSGVTKSDCIVNAINRTYFMVNNETATGSKTNEGSSTKQTTFDFDNPETLTPSLEAEPYLNGQANISGKVFTSRDVSISFSGFASGGFQAQLWTRLWHEDTQTADSCLRIVQGTRMTISVSNGYKIDKIYFDRSSSPGSLNLESGQVGKYTSSAGWKSESNTTQSVSFINAGSDSIIWNITVEYSSI